MPATAGRVKMPHNNRVSTSSTLGTNAVWKDVIKYDPYGGDASAPSAVRAPFARSLLSLAVVLNSWGCAAGAGG